MDGLNFCGSSVCGAFLGGLNLLLCLETPVPSGAVLERRVPGSPVVVGGWAPTGGGALGVCGGVRLVLLSPARDQQGPSAPVVGWRVLRLKIWNAALRVHVVSHGLQSVCRNTMYFNPDSSSDSRCGFGWVNCVGQGRKGFKSTVFAPAEFSGQPLRLAEPYGLCLISSVCRKEVNLWSEVTFVTSALWRMSTIRASFPSLLKPTCEFAFGFSAVRLTPVCLQTEEISTCLGWCSVNWQEQLHSIMKWELQKQFPMEK